VVDTEPPSKPTGLWECVADFTNAVPFCWTPSTDNFGVVAYDVYMRQGTAFAKIGTTTANLTRPYFAATGLVAGQFYTFYVVARDAAGNVSVPSDLYTARAQQGLPPPLPCAITYSANDWGTGFSATVAIRNPGTIAINGWTLRLVFSGNQRVTSAWNATYSQSPPTVWFTNLARAPRIDPGQTYTLGFNATYTGTNARPTGFALNGAPCTVTYR
jgi:hypothetical protein